MSPLRLEVSLQPIIMSLMMRGVQESRGTYLVKQPKALRTQYMREDQLKLHQSMSIVESPPLLPAMSSAWPDTTYVSLEKASSLSRPTQCLRNKQRKVLQQCSA